MDVQDYLSQLAAGCFLISSDNLWDPNFERTVVLICQYSAGGVYGLVLNRPSHIPLSEIFNLPDQSLNRTKTIYIGGPVSQSDLQILQVTQEPVPNSLEVVPGVFLGGQYTDIQTIIQSEIPSLRLFLGYSGWGPGQLEKEIRMGGWQVYRGNTQRILQHFPEPWADGLENFIANCLEEASDPLNPS